jgi:hypothetical protein
VRVHSRSGSPPECFTIFRPPKRFERKPRLEDYETLTVLFECSLDHRLRQTAQRPSDDLAEPNEAIERIEIVIALSFVRPKPVPEFFFVALEVR